MLNKLIRILNTLLSKTKSNRILAHTFEGNVPADLVELYPPARMTDKNASVEVLGSSKGFIIEAAMPFTHGASGRVRIGQSDRNIRERLYALSSAVTFIHDTVRNPRLCPGDYIDLPDNPSDKKSAYGYQPDWQG